MDTRSRWNPDRDSRGTLALLDALVDAPEDHRGGPDQAPDEADLDSDEE